jgi:hypothetical protein
VLTRLPSTSHSPFPRLGSVPGLGVAKRGLEPAVGLNQLPLSPWKELSLPALAWYDHGPSLPQRPFLPRSLSDQESFLWLLSRATTV